MAELVDAQDLKSCDSNIVPVRFRLRAIKTVTSYANNEPTQAPKSAYVTACPAKRTLFQLRATPLDVEMNASNGKSLAF